MLLLELLGNFVIPELIAYSVMLCALVLLETNHNRGQLELLCMVSHIKLGPESTTLYLCMSFYFLFFHFMLGSWTSILRRGQVKIKVSETSLGGDILLGRKGSCTWITDILAS